MKYFPRCSFTGFYLLLCLISAMQKIYYLSTCSTCKRILDELNPGKSFTMQDIKKEAITAGQLEEMKNLSGSYESLFSRRSQQYKALNLKDKKLAEADYRDLILSEYTFLKRPVIINGKQIFIGNEP